MGRGKNECKKKLKEAVNRRTEHGNGGRKEGERKQRKGLKKRWKEEQKM